MIDPTRRRLLLVPLDAGPLDLPSDVTITAQWTDQVRACRAVVLRCPRFDPVDELAEAPRITVDELHAL